MDEGGRSTRLGEWKWARGCEMSKYVPMAAREKREEREKGTREKEIWKTPPRGGAHRPFFFLSHSKWKLHVVVGKQFNRVRSFFISFFFFLFMRDVWDGKLGFEGMGGGGGFIYPSYGVGYQCSPNNQSCCRWCCCCLYTLYCLIWIMDGTVMLCMWCKGIRDCYSSDVTETGGPAGGTGWDEPAWSSLCID